MNIISLERLLDVNKRGRLATILQAEATRQGLRHKDIAEMASYSITAISRALSGDMPIGKDMAERLADALKMNREMIVSMALAEKELAELIERYRDYPGIQRYFSDIQRGIGVA